MKRRYTLKRRAEHQENTRRRIVQAAVDLHSSLGPGRTRRAIYDWYQRNAGLVACALRDAKYHALTREIAALKYGPQMTAYYEVLGKTLSNRQCAILHLALSFFTWRTLVRESGLKQKAAVLAMVQAITE